MKNTKIFVGNLPHKVEVQDVLDLFSKFGAIIDHYKPADKPFLFITFQDEQSAKTAISEMNGYSLDGRSIIVDIAKPKNNNRGNNFNNKNRFRNFR